MSNWNRGGRYHGGFPPHIRAQAQRDLPDHCAHCHRTDTRLWIDHITPAAEGGPHTIDNAQKLCTACHATKTRAEAARGRQRRLARGRRPQAKHPGLS